MTRQKASSTRRCIKTEIWAGSSINVHRVRRHPAPEGALRHFLEFYGCVELVRKRLFVFEGVVGGACRLLWVVVVRWSLRRPVWMRLRMV